MTVQSINPATEQLIAEYPETSSADVEVRLQMAEETFQMWRSTAFSDRASRMTRLAEVLRQEAERLARLMTEEMGKPIEQARAEIEKCAWGCDFYAEHAEGFLALREEQTPASRAYVRYDPLGAVLAIMPWNFPYWQVFRAAVPAIMAGNVVVLKHASNVSGVALEIEKLFVLAEFPAGVFSTLLMSSERTEELIGHRCIRGVTLTGSERAGRAVAAASGEHLKPSVLELGGSDPFIVLDDADLANAANQAARARCQNSGQSCIAAKRFIVIERIAKEFEAALVEAMTALRVGDPMNEKTDVGPLARADLRKALHEQVRKSQDQGARLLCGGEVPRERGFYYPPTVLSDVMPGMAAFDEETFGPVAAVITAKDADEAVRLANRSQFGLGASIWTGEIAAAESMASQLDAGSVFINAIVKSDPHLPFGGVKNSGYGRELSREGIREFVNIKTVWVA